jgi:hypothetical protein
MTLAHAPRAAGARSLRAARVAPEVALVWLLATLALVAVFMTYSRLPAAELYNVSGTGVRAGLSRMLVELNFPDALIAVAVLVVVAPWLPRRVRPLALLAGALCVVFALPGVVRQSNLDARWINAIPALGVALAFPCSLTARAPAKRRPRGDPLRLVLAVVLLLCAAEWIAAELGFFLDGVPVLGRIFQTGRLVSFHDAPHHAVHHGVHHGLQGFLLVLTALLLSRLPVGRGAALLLSLLLAYGLGNMANDAWREQIAERGWTGYAIPSVLEPAVNWMWLAVLVLAALTWLAWFGRRRA